MSKKQQIIALASAGHYLEQIVNVTGAARDYVVKVLRACEITPATTPSTALKEDRAKYSRASVRRLQANLDIRDAYIVRKGLWLDFVSSLPKLEDK